MTVYYKSPVNNKINSGSYDKLSKCENLQYFEVRFFKTYSEAKKQPDYKI